MESDSLRKAIAECEQEPIQIPGAVQAHGVLFALHLGDFTILQVSDNCYELLGIDAGELLHQPLSRLMDTTSVEIASRKLGERNPRLLNSISIAIKAHGKLETFEGILHRSGQVLILEVERRVGEKAGHGEFFEAVRRITSSLMLSSSLDEALRLTCDELRELTEFSRVLIYKFDEDWNGTVVAESRQIQVESLLQHKFPASDIPKQARELYTTNWLRLIPTVNYRPAKLVPVNNPITSRPLDLSHSVLRSVSPVHLEYMRNMGQAASMSISLLKGRKLWGLISCHHEEARFLKYDLRVAAEFIGQMVSSQIVAREDAADVDHRLQLKGIYDQLLRKGGAFADIPHVLAANSSMFLSLTNSPGAALVFGGEIRLIGNTPCRDQVKDLCKWVSSETNSILETDHLIKRYAKCKPYINLAAGVLAINIPNEPGGLIVWFRPEQTENIAWGGNPDASKIASEDGKIHPRKSFRTWFENVAERSLKWRRAEIEAADELRLVIMGMASKHMFSSGNGDQRSEFRGFLADSIATTNATKDARNLIADQDSRQASEIYSIAERSRKLLDGMTDMAILFLDDQGVILNWSTGANRLMGYTSQEVLGGKLSLFVSEHESLLLSDDIILHEARKSGGTHQKEIWLYRADKTSFWGKIIITSLKSNEDGPAGFSVVIQNVTSEKAAEEELKSTKLSAEMANRAKSAFLANISHEIRTPLGAVLGFAELLGMDNQSKEERSELSSRIALNGAQLTTLINDLLDLSKVESGRLEVEFLDLELPQLLIDVHQTLNFKASEKSIHFEVIIQGKLPWHIVSDPTRIRQILINLVGNAIKFTGRGGKVALTCSLVQASTGQKIAFRVSDSGRGMSEAEMSRLFQPFTQADVSMTRRYGGTGLGLFVSQKLARSLGGDLVIENSVVGRGSTFLASIDAGESEYQRMFDTLEAPKTIAVTNRIKLPELTGVRVLVVDDSQDNQQLIRLFLTKAGAHVEVANDGKQGSDRALAEPFDIVLLDVQMPIMDGNSAMRILASKSYQKPVIALTAHAMAAEREYSLSLGFSEYLTKPIDRDLLVQTIYNLVCKRKQQDS